MMMDVQTVRSMLDGLVMDKAQINVEIVEMDSRSKSNNVMMVIQIAMMAAQTVSSMLFIHVLEDPPLLKIRVSYNARMELYQVQKHVMTTIAYQVMVVPSVR